MEGEAGPIVAMATAPAPAALAVVRLSCSMDPNPFLAAACPSARPPWPRRRPRLAEIVDRDGCPMDQALVTWFAAPRSATGEHVVEFSLHGNPVVARELVELLVSAGARRAGPGEFTRRAVLNGRLDLAEAEAVAALVSASSLAAVRAARRVLGGELTEALLPARHFLAAAAARLEAALDFPEQTGAMDAEAGSGELASARNELERLAALGRRRVPRMRGARAVIAGPVNAGKSTLFNALLGEARAIVAAEPGTTRDLIEAELVPGIALVDSAGLRPEAGGTVEAEGQRRALEAQAAADLVLWVRDGSRDRLESDEPLDFLSLRVATHADLVEPGQREPGWRWVSGTNGEGIDALRAEIESEMQRGWGSEGVGPVSARQCAALEAAAAAVGQALVLVEDSEWALALDRIARARSELEALLGERLDPEVMDALFAGFCVGK